MQRTHDLCLCCAHAAAAAAAKDAAAAEAAAALAKVMHTHTHTHTHAHTHLKCLYVQERASAAGQQPQGGTGAPSLAGGGPPLAAYGVPNFQTGAPAFAGGGSPPAAYGVPFVGSGGQSFAGGGPSYGPSPAPAGTANRDAAMETMLNMESNFRAREAEHGAREAERDRQSIMMSFFKDSGRR